MRRPGCGQGLQVVHPQLLLQLLRGLLLPQLLLQGQLLLCLHGQLMLLWLGQVGALGAVAAALHSHYLKLPLCCCWALLWLVLF